MSRSRADRQGGRGHEAAAPSAAHAPLAAPAWANAPAAAPFSLGGVQRKVEINEPGDSFEREAESVAQRVASGQSVSPDSFSALAPGALGNPSQRAAAPAEKKKDEKPAVPKAAAPEKKKDETPPSVAVQKAAASDDKKKELSKPAPVQKAAVPDEKKKETPPVQKAAKPDEKKPEEKKPASVQKAAAPEKKKDDKPAAVQKAAAPAEKKKEENLAGVQKAPTEKKKDEKPPTVQKAAAPENKKEDKPAVAVQKAAADDRKKEPPAPAAVQKEGKKREKKEGETLEDKLKDAPVQKAAAPEKKKEESPKPAVQKSSGSSGSVTPAMETSAAQAIQRKGAGEPMNSGTRGALESRMGADLSGVRVHQDDAARQASSDIGARAFTHGSDIWLGHGESQSDVGLMAHEATHVVQQNAGVGRMLVQRKKAAGSDDGGDWDFESKLGKIRKTGEKAMSLPMLQVPNFKKDLIKPPVTLPKKIDQEDAEEEKETRPNDQRQIWDGNVEAAPLGQELVAKCEKEKAPSQDIDGQPTFFFRLGNREFFVIGSKEELTTERLKRPRWNDKGEITQFHVDHKRELQISTEEDNAHDIKNMWLLEASANTASGQNIKQKKNELILELLQAATKKKSKGKKAKDSDSDEPTNVKEGKQAPIFDESPKLEEVRKEYTITFEKVKGGLDPKDPKPDTWTLEEIKKGKKQVDVLKPLTADQVKRQNLRGKPDELVLYTNPHGGGRRFVPWGKDKGKGENEIKPISYGKTAFTITGASFDEDEHTGKVKGTAFNESKVLKPVPIDVPIKQMPAVTYGGYISSPDLLSEFKKKAPDVKGSSPVEVFDIELTDKGFFGRGKVLPTVPIIKDIGIDLVFDGDNVYLSKIFTAGDLKFPGPIKVSGASLQIFAGTQGIGLQGIVLFGIDRVGQGKLTASASTGAGFFIGGEFNFDSELFDPASIHIEYKYADGVGTLSGGGKLGIPEGKVRGIKSALLTVDFLDDKIDATGVVKPNIPAVEQGSMEFHYSPETGVVIAGRLDLKKDTPGIEGGWVSAELAKRKGEDRWKVKAHGEAVPKIPGVSTKVVVDYDDGLFDILGTAAYEKGMLKGSITIGATNRPVSPDGVPAAGPPPDKASKVILYGGGSLTLKLSPWLQATAAIRLLPNGEIEVTGKIGLPAALPLFGPKPLEKNLVKVGIDIPIVGVSVAGQRIGIFANITGGVDLIAGIGPGELQEVELGVTYNPSHEDQTHVFGGAKLHIPAHAGIRLFVRGSLGVGIPLVSASAGIEVGGMLGIAGALDAAVQVDWTPAKGLDIQAMAEVYASPKFVFDVTGFVLVELDTWVHTWELYSKKWKLASFEYGSGLRLGLKLPIHYQEGKQFDVSLSDVQFEVPTIEPGGLLEGLVDRIA